MPKSAQYTVRWSAEQAGYVLSGVDDGTQLIGQDESWFAWLEQHHAFAFHGRQGQINLLKEKRSRGSEGYWYAYRRHQGKMLKRYAGRNAQLSLERLEEMVAQLADGEEEGIAQPSSSAPVEPLLMPKLQLPPLQRSLLPRERLFALLDQGLERKVTLIAGPAGYGKTTLVSQWIASRSERADFPRVASVTLDEGDNDPVRFWHYVIAACQKFRAGFGKEALELLLAHRIPPFKPLHMVLVSLLNELSQLEHPCILLFDDFHVISSPQVTDMLSFFLDHLPASVHLVLLIRGDPPFSLARLRARNELLDIYPPRLAFSLEETRAFFERELPFTLQPKVVRQIFERIDGWPAGLRLLARELQWSSSAQDIEHIFTSLTGNHWSLQEYFLSEVLHTLPEEQQEFLLQTSFLPRVTASLCNAVRERNDSARLLEMLRGGDLFLIPLDTRGEWGRYHFLFAEAMQQEARRRLGDAHLQQLAARASAWYEEHGYLTEATETALSAADFPRLATLVEQFIASRQQNNTSTVPELYALHRWMEHLPEEELERHPDLYLHYAMTLLFLQMNTEQGWDGKERIQGLLQAAEQHWRDANNTEKLAEVFAFRALLARRDGKMLQAVTWARQALSWLPQEERSWRNLALTVVGIGEVLDGSLANAREFILEALQLNEQLGNATYARAVKGMLAWVSAEQGELRHAAEQFRQMQAEARGQEDRDDIARTQLGLAMIAYQWNNLQEAEQATYEAQAINEQMDVEELHAGAAIRLAFIEHARGQSEQAMSRLTAWLARKQAPITPHSYQLSREVQAALTRIQLAHGDFADAERWFAGSERRQETLPLYQRRREQLLRIRFLLAQDKESAAVEQLERLHAEVLKTGHIFFAYEVQAVLILSYAKQGEHKKARELLVNLLQTTRSEEYLRLYLDEGEQMAELLRTLLPYVREKAVQSYMQRILNAFARETTMEEPGAQDSATPLLEPLSPQEHKVLRLLAAGNSNGEIAHALVVSVNTVRTQVQSIYRKLNVNNRVEASAVANELNLL